MGLSEESIAGVSSTVTGLKLVADTVTSALPPSRSVLAMVNVLASRTAVRPLISTVWEETGTPLSFVTL